MDNNPKYFSHKSNLDGRIIFTLLVSLLILEGCTSALKNNVKTKHHTESLTLSDKQEFQEIESLFSQKLLEPAELKIVHFEKHFPQSAHLPSVENFHGLIFLQKKAPAEAALYFKKAILHSTSQKIFREYILYNLASAQFNSNQLDQAQETLAEINPLALDAGNRLKIFYLKANIYEKKSLPLEAIRELLSAIQSITESDFLENKKTFSSLLNQSLQNINEVSMLESLYGKYKNSPVADAFLFRLATQEMMRGNIGNSENLFKTLIAQYPQSSYYSQAADLISHPKTDIPVESHTIGVLLPMKGKFAKFGSKSLQGIQLALGIFGQSEPDHQINLVVEESGDEPEIALKAINRLVYKHHVVAIIGPLLTKGIDQIAQKAQELGVPLLSLARRASAPLQDYVFQAGLTQQLQAFEIAHYAIQKLGLKKFAIIYPNDKLGIEISQSFWKATESMGGKIVGIEPYHAGETDFRQPIDKLSGLYYPEARQRELNLLAREREANHIIKRTRKTEQFYNLKPIVDYDAIFIPDEPQVTGQILPTFAYRDIEHVLFLGTSSWNSPDFLARTQSYSENSIFVDAFFPESSSLVVQKFIEKYKNTFGQAPSSLEAIAYDAGLLIENAIHSSKNPSRADIRDALRSSRNILGVTGTLSFQEGQFFRDLPVIQVKNGRFIEAQ